MQSHFFSQLILAFNLMLISVHVHAMQWYHVELLIFEQLGTITDEQWPHMHEFHDNYLNPSMATTEIQPAITESLSNEANRLKRSAGYQVQYHNAWQQPIMAKNKAKSVKIDSSNDLVEGTIRLYKATYLHAELDLWLKQNAGMVNSWSDGSSDGIDINTPRNPNLAESRRIRSKKLYFFDHPKMGALLELTPIETPVAVQSNLEQLESFSLPTEAAPTVNE